MEFVFALDNHVLLMGISWPTDLICRTVSDCCERLSEGVSSECFYPLMFHTCNVLHES
jgi:hypothetical protein